MGLHAIKDGYYREAVANFSSALERFYEFFIKTICISRKIELAKVDKAWSNVSSQSERQLGAFVFLHLLEFNEKPNILSSNKEVPYRNSVIHKGKIPTNKEAIWFGNVVLKLIQLTVKKLKTDYRDSYATLFGERTDDLDPDVNVSHMTIPTPVSIISHAEHRENIDIETALSELYAY